MSDHKTRFQQIRENNMTRPAAPAPDINAAYYAASGNVRNICFAWQHGERLILNYAYLVAVHLQPEEGCISLTFTTHKIAIKGLRLEALFIGLMDQLPRIISCADARYATLADQNEPFVTGIDLLSAE